MNEKNIMDKKRKAINLTLECGIKKRINNNFTIFGHPYIQKEKIIDNNANSNKP